MDINQIKAVVKEVLKATKLELHHSCAGNTGTTYYHVVGTIDDEEVLRIPIGNDGFNDGDQLGFQVNSVKETSPRNQNNGKNRTKKEKTD